MKTKLLMLCVVAALASACADRAPPTAAQDTPEPTVADASDKLEHPAQTTPAASGAATPAQTALDRSGDIVIGTAFADLKARGPWTAMHGADVVEAQSCEMYTGPALPAALSMMVVNGKVARFDLREPDQSGPFGVHVGMTEEQARALLPADIEVQPHHYGSGAGGEDHYLSWRSPDGTGAVRVETMQGKVEAMYWGDWDAVQFVEGCL